MSASLASTSATTVVASPLTSPSSQDAKTALVAASLSSSAASPLLPSSSPRSRSTKLHSDGHDSPPRSAGSPSSPNLAAVSQDGCMRAASSSRHTMGTSSLATPAVGLPLVDDALVKPSWHAQSSYSSSKASSSLPNLLGEGERRAPLMREPSLARAPTRQGRNVRQTAAGATVVGGGVDLKVVILGAQGVGKTSLVHRYITGTFQASSIPSTIGASFLTQKLVVDGTKVRLQLWDTAGQERFRSMAPMYYRGSNAAVIVYDITNAASFQDVKTWIEELRKNVTSDLIIHVVGSKLDLAPAHREVYLDEARDAVAGWTAPDAHAVGASNDFPASQSPASPSRLGLGNLGLSSSRIGFSRMGVSSAVPAGAAAGANSNASSGTSGSAGSSEAGGGASNVQTSSLGRMLSSWESVEVTEVSAKAGEAVEDVFVNIAGRLVERKAEIEAERRRRDRDSIMLRDESDAATAGRASSGGSHYVSSRRGGWGGCC